MKLTRVVNVVSPSIIVSAQFAIDAEITTTVMVIEMASAPLGSRVQKRVGTSSIIRETRVAPARQSSSKRTLGWFFLICGSYRGAGVP